MSEEKINEPKELEAKQTPKKQPTTTIILAAIAAVCAILAVVFLVLWLGAKNSIPTDQNDDSSSVGNSDNQTDDETDEKKDEISVNADGYVVVNGVTTEILADKDDVITVEDGYLVVNGVRTEYEIKNKNHSFGEWKLLDNENETDCEKMLYYRTCTDCSTIEWKEGRYEDHSFKTATTQPTCQAGGYDTKTCTLCGKVEICNETPLSDHSYLDTYTYDNSFHWKKCENCESTTEKVEHNLDDDGICTVCNQFIGATEGNGDENSSGNGENDNDPTNDFTVQLMVNDQPFIPESTMKVYWNDGYNVHIADVDETGFAKVDGLDGDYNVTLSGIPEGYAYDANGYVATNDNRNITIQMYSSNMLRDSGDDVYDCYLISDTGIYTITVESEKDLSYIRFAPQCNGIFTVESWVSTAEDEISPICLAYLGHEHYIYGEYKVTDVGACGNYTRNFVHTVNIADENISSVGGGSETFTFAIGAESKSGVYPVDITFVIKYNGGFDYDRPEKTLMLPTQDWSSFDFDAFNALAGGKIHGAETIYMESDESYVFDQSCYKLWSVAEGGDGVYHVYNPEKYPETNGYGPVLVAYITKPFRFNDEAFTTMEDAGNNALVVQGLYNYRIFIEGFSALAAERKYCIPTCLCHIDGSVLACSDGCPDCTIECNPCSEEEFGVLGYADYVNSDGVVPVTEELKTFLQLFVTGSFYYFDEGEGIVERDFNIDAYEDSQWLFACGYYE